MKKRDPKTGQFVRTNPDYKAMYERKHMECDKLEHELKLQKEGYELLRQDLQAANADRDRWLGYCNEKDYRIEFLLDHAGPILTLLYKHKFCRV